MQSPLRQNGTHLPHLPVPEGFLCSPCRFRPRWSGLPTSTKPILGLAPCLEPDQNTRNGTPRKRSKANKLRQAWWLVPSEQGKPFGVWLKINELGLRSCLPLVPFSKVRFWLMFLLSHSHVGGRLYESAARYVDCPEMTSEIEFLPTCVLLVVLQQLLVAITILSGSLDIWCDVQGNHGETLGIA